MSMNLFLIFLTIGSVAGLLGGMLGIGGAIVVIPALVLLCDFPQQRAVGTSLAMLLPPIGIFAVMRYYQADQIDLPAAAVMAGAFALAAWVGSWLVSTGYLPEKQLRAMFAFFLLYVAVLMLFRTEKRVWIVLNTLMLWGVYGLSFLLFRTLGRRWERKHAIDEVYRKKLELAVAPDYVI